LARRLRPDDLWLDHAQHSCAETAAWDWDLRPLDRGEPAVPLPVSGRDGVRPHTSVVREAVEAALAEGSFADQAILSEMLHGVEDDSRCRRGTLLCAPHAGAIAELAIAVGKAEADVANGWASGGHQELPCWPLRTCPYSVVDESERAGKPKHRLTIDLSWPHVGMLSDGGGPVDSVNGAMDRSGWPEGRLLRVAQYAEALEVLRGGEERRRVRAWSLDCRAFYRAVGRQRREIWRNGVFLPSGVRLDERCCFGDAAAATKCTRISNFLADRIRRAIAAFDEAHPTREPAWMAWQAARAAAGQAAPLSWFGLYIDDGVAGGADDLVWTRAGRPVLEPSGGQLRRQWAHFRLAREVLARYGWSSEESKEQPPAESVEALGVFIDISADGRMLLTDAKRRRYARAARELADAADVSPRRLLQVVGKLQFASQLFPVGRQRLHALWRLARVSSRRADGRVPVSDAARAELAWWRRELTREPHEGVPLACCGELPAVGEGTTAIYADASSAGYAAWCLASGCVLMVGGVWSAAERERLTIAELELLASTIGLVALSERVGARRVVSFTDNTVAEAAMRSTAPASAAAQRLAARRSEWLYERGAVEAARRVTTEANLWADIGSRPELGGLAEVARQARRLGLRAERIEEPPDWRDTSELTAA